MRFGGPHVPIFDPGKKRGQVVAGTAIGTPPPVGMSLTVIEDLQDNTNLSGIGGLQAVGTELFVAGGSSNSLVAVDISDPTNISIISSLSHANLNAASDVFVDGTTAYVISGLNNRLTVVDVSNPASMSVLGTVNHVTNLSGARQVIADGSFCYVTAGVGDRLTVVDVSTPASPTIVGSVNAATNLNGAFGVVKDGTDCFVAAYDSDRLTRVDVTTAASPTVNGSVNNSALNTASRLVKRGNYCYITTDTTGRIAVVDVSTPSTPSFVDSLLDLTVFDGCTGITQDAAYPDHLFVCAYNSDAVVAVDVTTATAPVVDTSVTDALLDGAFLMAQDGAHLYVSCSDQNRITVVEIT